MTLDELREYRKKSKEQEAHEEKLRLAQYAAMQNSLEHMRAHLDYLSYANDNRLGYLRGIGELQNANVSKCFIECSLVR
jgi:hypothetical protein